MSKENGKGNGLIVALLIILILCVIGLSVVLLMNAGIIGNFGDPAGSLPTGDTTSAPEITNTLLTPDSDTLPSGDTQNNEITDANTDETSAETTDKLAPETTESTAHTHSYGSWQTIKVSTCTEVGTEERKCSCGAKETQTIKALEHSVGNWITDKANTCTTDGSRHKECTRCGIVMQSQTLKASGHKDASWIVDEKATCTTDGSRHINCSYCGILLKTEALKSTGHYEVIENKEAATCTESGLTEGKFCAYCKAVIVAQQTVPALGGHDLKVTGECSRCKKDCSIDMSKRVGAPIEDNQYGFSFYMSSNSFLNISWEAKNISKKEIKYCTILLVGYNAVGDYVYSKNIKITGPISTGGNVQLLAGGFFNAIIFRDWMAQEQEITKMVISHIKLEYMDGSIEAGSYGYGTTYVNTKLS